MRVAIIAGLSLVALVEPTHSAEPDFAREAAAPQFARDIAPLLAARCTGCHGSIEPKGGLDLTSRAAVIKGGDTGPALDPADLNASLLLERVTAGEMPPKKPLSESEQSLLREWIAAGAVWGPDDRFEPLQFSSTERAGFDFWSLQPIRVEAPPTIQNTDWPRQPLDADILSELEQRGIGPAADAPPRVWLRRVYFDLIGLPPTPAELAAFEANSDAAARERIVDDLLSRPEYGERWARHWLDIVRYGESDGFERNAARPDAWAYRDWVIDSLNADRPYTDFAARQIAGDLLDPSEPAATGFLVAGPHNTVVGADPIAKELARHDELEDIVGTVSQTFLGLTVQCARCHDHKFDPISQRDYYRLTASLAGVEHGRRPAPPTATDRARALELDRITADIQTLEAAATKSLYNDTGGSNTLQHPAPRPAAAWRFDAGLTDVIDHLDAAIVSTAALTPLGLRTDNSGYAATTPLPFDLREKTLAAWVRLNSLDQRGGAAISIQSLDGVVFDAIVYGEQEPGRWMAGSDVFSRTRSFHGSEEHDAVERPVFIAITYGRDGRITAYRNGEPYGESYDSSGPVHFKAKECNVVFGLRHLPVDPGKMLKGSVLRAAIYDRALGLDEVKAAAVNGPFVTPEELAAAMSPDDRKRWTELRESAAQLRAELSAARTATLYCCQPSQPKTMHVFRRGNPAMLGDEALPGGLAALGSRAEFGLESGASDADRRRALAAWITSPENPLFTRVIVNRVWQYHFGVGLVETPSDFGHNGGRPSHPKLLDRLAADFAAGGYRWKTLHRQIVLSRTYGQSSRGGDASGADPRTIDVGNRLFWRMSPRRLEAEAVRDALLFVSGELNPQRGGPPYRDTREYENNGTRFYEPISAITPEILRRTIYRFSPRGERSPLLDTFDCPDPSAVTPRRQMTTTPLQALALLNDPLVLHCADRMAERLVAETDDPAVRVQSVFLKCVGRLPTEAEQVAALRLAELFGWPSVCRAVFNLGEFVLIE